MDEGANPSPSSKKYLTFQKKAIFIEKCKETNSKVLFCKIDRFAPMKCFLLTYCGIEQLAARRPHKPKVEGANPSPATIYKTIMGQKIKNTCTYFDSLKGYRDFTCFNLCNYNWLPGKARRNIEMS